MHKNAHPLADESVDVFSWLEIVFISIESSLFTMSQHMVQVMVFRQTSTHSLHWRHNERGSVSEHRPEDCLLNR